MATWHRRVQSCFETFERARLCLSDRQFAGLGERHRSGGYRTRQWRKLRIRTRKHGRDRRADVVLWSPLAWCDLKNQIIARRAARDGKLDSRDQLVHGGGRNPAFRTYAPRTFCAKFDIERSSANAAFSMARRSASAILMFSWAGGSSYHLALALVPRKEFPLSDFDLTRFWRATSTLTPS